MTQACGLFGELTTQWCEQRTLPEAAQLIVAAATAAIPCADLAAVTVVATNGEVSTVAATDACIAECDAAARAVADSPLRHELWTSPSVLVDAGGERRWKPWVTELQRHSVRSVLYFRLGAPAHRLRVLALYAREAESFTDRDRELAAVLAAVAAGTVIAFERQESLERALANRDTIGIAKGVLMTRFKITAEDAFRLLVVASQRGNVKLHQVARVVAETGELPLRGPGDPPLAVTSSPDSLAAAQPLDLQVTA